MDGQTNRWIRLSAFLQIFGWETCLGCPKMTALQQNQLMNASAAIVTANIRDFRQARKALGVKVMTPAECVLALIQTF